MFFLKRFLEVLWSRLPSFRLCIKRRGSDERVIRTLLFIGIHHLICKHKITVMGFDIPEPFKWDESFAVFYAQLDDEHKGLFDGIFACCNTNDAATLGSLVGKVKAHFAFEEGMMQKAGYADFPAHKKIHDEFVAKCGGVKAPCDAATLNFLKDWLVNHIKSVDFKYKGKLG